MSLGRAQDPSPVARYLLALLQDKPRLDLPDLGERQSEDLVRLASTHGVAALAHDALARSGLASKLAPPARDRLAKLRLEATAQHLLTSADLGRLATTLDAGGAVWAVMKGPALTYLGYGDPTLRWSSDLDVLVRPSQFGTAIDALVEGGATLLDLNWSLQLDMMRAEASLRLPLGTLLDLHWHPVNDARARSTTRLDIDTMLDRRRLVPNDARLPLMCLGQVDNMTLVALHASLSGGHRLVWAKDIERLARRDPPDWRDLAERAAHEHVALPVGVMLHRAARLLGADVPSGTLRSLLGGRNQTAIWSAGERFASPRMLGGCMSSGRAFMSSLRATPWQTAMAMVTNTRSHVLGDPGLRHGIQGKVARDDLTPDNPLHRARGGEQAKKDYLAAIAVDSRRP